MTVAMHSAYVERPYKRYVSCWARLSMISNCGEETSESGWAAVQENSTGFYEVLFDF